ncbi:MAG: ABC transporter permease, partial [Halanaerobiales bacterium]
MFLTKLAFKNLVRHRKRTLITAYIIAFAIFYYIAFDSVIAGMTELSYQSIIDNEAGHLQLVTEEYWQEEDELPLENLFSVNQEMMSAVSTVDSYQASSPELSFQSRLNNGMNELPVVGKGVVPDRFTEVFDIEQQFVNGEMFSAGENRVVMGKGLADLMKLSVGDYIILLVKDKNNTFNTIEAEVSGLIHTGNPNVNRNIVYLPLDIVQQALNVDKQISKLIVRLEDKDLAVNTEKQIEESFFHMGISGENYLNVYRWDQLEAVSVAGAKQAANNMIMFIILLIAAIAIINMVILAALERMKEIGMMKAMGLKVKEI